jgi:16S rRNA (guanine527-N7)-methyltransferase
MEYNKAKQLFEKYNLELSKEQYDDFSAYENILIEYNKVMNLTAITESEQIWVKHFLDSALLLKNVEIKPNSSLIDVGCGAGFPSIPIAIMRRDLKITCLDSLKKRVNFLDEVIKKLNLLNCKAVHNRAEVCGKDKNFREKFDFATARAVANMAVLSEYCIPFIKVDGLFVAMKGPNEDIENAVDAIVKLGAELIDRKNYDFEGNSRTIYFVEKYDTTPIQYPRNSNKIKNSPLK